MAPVSENMHVTAENSRFHKVLVEKSRRERINGSIEQMRALFHRAIQMCEENPDFSLDKADVLELAVSFLRHRAFSRANSNYARGFSHCLQETLRHVTLHARLQPKATEAVQCFYVRQRWRLAVQPGQLSHKPAKRSSSRSRAAMWRPWSNN